MPETKVTIVRHGETEWNVAMRLQGMQNSVLTENGIRQANMVAEALRHNNYHFIIASDLGRAIETAEAINRYHSLTIQKEPLLRERNFGVMEGLTREEIQEKYPEVHRGYMERQGTYQVPQGESLTEFYLRVTEGLKMITSRYKGKNILIVTHGGVLDCVMRMIFGYPLSAPRRFSIFNGSINTFLVGENGWSLEQWGSIDHQNSKCISLDD
jgi:2,3-bisphosphoglycerate-dependent phosphoglycerate mutase